jgi:RNA polymerase sigma factor for flagellar operon FliA
MVTANSKLGRRAMVVNSEERQRLLIENLQEVRYIARRIHDRLRQLDWSPRRLRWHARQIDLVNRELASELGRSPSEPEIAARLGVELVEFHRLLGELRGLNLGSLQVQSEDGFLEENLAVAATRLEEDPYHLTLRTEMRAILAQALEELDGRERQVVGLYYLEELTMKEVGVILDIGESRVCQIHTTALIRLRSRLQSALVQVPARSDSEDR